MYDYTKMKYLDAQEKERLFLVIDADTSTHSIRNRAIFYLSFYAALRVSEVGMIYESDLNLYNKEIYCKRLKGSRNNTLRIIDNRVYSVIMEYVRYKKEHYNPSPYLFPSQKGNPISRKTLDDMMKRYCSISNISKEKSHFHVLKHTRAIELAELGLDTKDIQYWLGHKSIKSTEVYLEFTTKQQDWLYRKLLYLSEQHQKSMFQN